jgi:hypothetical protein
LEGGADDDADAAEASFLMKMGAKVGADRAGTFATGMIISPPMGFFIRKAVSK